MDYHLTLRRYFLDHHPSMSLFRILDNKIFEIAVDRHECDGQLRQATVAFCPRLENYTTHCARCGALELIKSCNDGFGSMPFSERGIDGRRQSLLGYQSQDAFMPSSSHGRLCVRALGRNWIMHSLGERSMREDKASKPVNRKGHGAKRKVVR